MDTDNLSSTVVFCCASDLEKEVSITVKNMHKHKCINNETVLIQNMLIQHNEWKQHSQFHQHGR